MTPDPAEGPESTVAGFWTRVGGSLLDFGAFLPLLLLDRWVWNASASSMLLLLWVLLYFGASLAYRVGFTLRLGQTPGKLALGMRVVSLDGQALSSGQVLLRESLMPVLSGAFILIYQLQNILAGQFYNRGLGEFSAFWPFLLCSWGWMLVEAVVMRSNTQHRSVHDLLARTRVVRTAPRRQLLAVLAPMYVLTLVLPNFLTDDNIQTQLNDERLYLQATQLVKERLAQPHPLAALAEVEQKGLLSDGFFPPFDPVRNRASALEAQPGQFIVSGEIRFEDGEVKASYPWHCNLRRDGRVILPELSGEPCVLTGRDIRAAAAPTPAATRVPGHYDMRDPDERSLCLKEGYCDIQDVKGVPTITRKTMDARRQPRVYNLTDSREADECLRNSDCEYQQELGINIIVRKKNPDGSLR